MAVTKKPPRNGGGFKIFRAGNLFADAELFLSDDGAVAVDVFAHQVVEQTTTLTYKHLKGAFGCMIFVI